MSTPERNPPRKLELSTFSPAPHESPGGRVWHRRDRALGPALAALCLLSIATLCSGALPMFVPLMGTTRGGEVFASLMLLFAVCVPANLMLAAGAVALRKLWLIIVVAAVTVAGIVIGGVLRVLAVSLDEYASPSWMIDMVALAVALLALGFGVAGWLRSRRGQSSWMLAAAGTTIIAIIACVNAAQRQIAIFSAADVPTPLPFIISVILNVVVIFASAALLGFRSRIARWIGVGLIVVQLGLSIQSIQNGLASNDLALLVAAQVAAAAFTLGALVVAVFAALRTKRA